MTPTTEEDHAGPSQLPEDTNAGREGGGAAMYSEAMKALFSTTERDQTSLLELFEDDNARTEGGGAAEGGERGGEIALETLPAGGYGAGRNAEKQMVFRDSEGATLARIWGSGSKRFGLFTLHGLAKASTSSHRPEPPVFQCSICEDFKNDTFPTWRQRSIEELDTGASQRCKYCDLLSRGIRACLPDNELQDEAKLSTRLDKLMMREGRDGRNLNRYGISVFTIDEAPNSRWTDHKVPLGKIPSGNTQSKEAMATAKLWLKDCQDNHTTCGPGILVPPPTRLLEITTQAEPEASFKVRLVELGDTHCRYAALSHCWGQTNSIKTTLETLEARKTDIPWADLCRTFKDAITTAHELDLSYIWIDSLCIIQNSKEDWQNEAANMAAIYEGALITIAATRSSNHDGGCFSEMSQAFRTHKVSLSSSSGEEDAADGKPPLYFRQMIPHCLTTIHSTEQAEEFPLLTRGWVYQERLLSPRMLHFNNHELSWECNTLTTCECANPDGHISSGLRPPYLNEPALPKLEHTDAIFGRGLSGHSLALTSRWHNIVTEFTGLGLTVEGDALPALAGVASQISRLRRDAAARSQDGAGAAEEQQNLEAWEERQQDNTYFAGLWTGSLFYDLLWTAESDAAPRPSAYRGPSWSWMATRSPVNYDTADVPAMVEFYPRFWGMGGVATIAGTDPFGAVEPPTSLLLEGRMLDAKVRYKEDQQKQQQQQQLPQGETGGVAAKATTGPAAGTRPQMVQRWAAAQKASDYDIELADGSGLGTHASFHADYGLRWDEGYDYVPDGFPVQLMLVAKSDNYFFYLVLVRVRLFVPDPQQDVQDTMDAQQDVQDTMDGSDASGAGEGRQNTGFAPSDNVQHANNVRRFRGSLRDAWRRLCHWIPRRLKQVYRDARQRPSHTTKEAATREPEVRERIGLLTVFHINGAFDVKELNTYVEKIILR